MSFEGQFDPDDVNENSSWSDSRNVIGDPPPKGSHLESGKSISFHYTIAERLKKMEIILLFA